MGVGAGGGRWGEVVRGRMEGYKRWWQGELDLGQEVIPRKKDDRRWLDILDINGRRKVEKEGERWDREDRKKDLQRGGSGER